MNKTTSRNSSTRNLALTAASLLIASGLAQAATTGSRFDPNDFASNGALTLVATDTIVFDTDAGTYDINAGGAVAGGATATSESGNVQMAMFNFDSITIPAGVTVTVTGARGIVLGSLGNIDLGSDISVAGTNAPTNSLVIGLGGPGAEGGVKDTSFLSNPPGSTGGDGGGIASDGVGWGAGQGVTDAAGAGGAYGGAGGSGQPGITSLGGTAYGDEMLTDLYGGSGGGGGQGAYQGLGGGGGGAIQLTAVGTITLTATLDASGGKGGDKRNNNNTIRRGGGGGSGGGILLTAESIVLDTGSLLDAGGGDRGVGEFAYNNAAGFYGGAGSGGRIAIYSNSLTQNGSVDLTAGVDAASNLAEAGTFFTAGLTAAANLTWTADTDTAWDITTANWNTGTATFALGDNVLFDATATALNSAVTLDVVVSPGSTTFDTSSFDYSLTGSGDISGLGTLVKTGTGTLTLATANSYSGTTTVENGVLQLDDGGTPGSGDIVLDDGIVTNTGTLTVNRSDTFTLANLISGGGGVIQTGTGTTVLGNDNTYTGATTVSAGTLQIDGDHSAATGAVSVASGATLGGTGTVGGNTTIDGTLAAGTSVGTLGFAGTLSFATNSTLAWEIADWFGGAGTGWDLVIADTLDFTAVTSMTLTITEASLANFVAWGPATFTIASATTAINGFNAGNVTIDDSGFTTGAGTWAVQQNSLDLELVYTPPATPPVAATSGSRFDPNDFASNGPLSLVATDTIVFDTDGGTFEINSGGAMPGGALGVSQSGEVELVMFNFDSISIPSGVTITVTGDRGIALGSLGTLSIESNISVAGTNSNNLNVGKGGPGAEGGVAGSTFDSAPPPANAGNGGGAGGFGKGHGGGTGTGTPRAGNGGGYGGAGGLGEQNTVGGGSSYGDPALTDLYGGSGGSGGQGTAETAGGGGGGTIQLTAVGTLTLNSTLNAVGGRGDNISSSFSGRMCGGGGSGGAILINAPTVVLDVASVLDASGGNGGVFSGSGFGRDGGGGGGGRIAIHADSLTQSGTYDVSGGSTGDTPGAAGTFWFPGALTAYGTWAQTNITDIDPGALAGFEDDADGDGLSNGLEWVLGGDPLSADLAGVLPGFAGDATNGLTLVFNRAPDSIASTTLTVEWGTDLTFPNSIAIGTSDVGPDGDNPTVDIDAPGTDQVTVNIPAANAAGGKIFARLKLVEN